MSNKTAVTVKKADAPAEWGTRGEVGALAERFATMLPNAKKLSQGQILAAAQYSRLMDLNPFRGEVYFFPGKGGELAVVDGYKALVRWADDKAPYDEWYESLPLNEEEAHKFRCWILREDRKAAIPAYIELGATFAEAREMVATFSDGVVTRSDMTQRNGQPKDPPTGWTWEQVARKRALKNALNLSHGAPSPREMAKLSWDVNGTQTLPEDWDGAEELGQYEAEQLAELRAKTREWQGEQAKLTPEERQAQFAKNNILLHGDPGFEGFDTPAEAPPDPDYESVPDQDAEPEPKPQANVNEPRVRRNGTLAIVKTKKWAPASVALAESLPYYQKKDGAPDGYHMAGAALKCGHKEITDANLVDVITDLTEYAQVQQALDEEETQQPQDKEQPGLPF